MPCMRGADGITTRDSPGFTEEYNLDMENKSTFHDKDYLTTAGRNYLNPCSGYAVEERLNQVQRLI